MSEFKQATKVFQNRNLSYLPDITVIFVPVPNITFCPVCVTHSYTSAQKRDSTTNWVLLKAVKQYVTRF